MPASRATVPKAPVHEDHDAFGFKQEIWAPKNRARVQLPPGEPLADECHAERKFGRAVIPSSDRTHRPRAHIRYALERPVAQFGAKEFLHDCPY